MTYLGGDPLVGQGLMRSGSAGLRDRTIVQSYNCAMSQLRHGSLAMDIWREAVCLLLQGLKLRAAPQARGKRNAKRPLASCCLHRRPQGKRILGREQLPGPAIIGGSR